MSPTDAERGAHTVHRSGCRHTRLSSHRHVQDPNPLLPSSVHFPISPSHPTSIPQGWGQGLGTEHPLGHLCVRGPSTANTGTPGSTRGHPVPLPPTRGCGHLLPQNRPPEEVGLRLWKTNKVGVSTALPVPAPTPGAGAGSHRAGAECKSHRKGRVALVKCKQHSKSVGKDKC